MTSIHTIVSNTCMVNSRAQVHYSKSKTAIWCQKYINSLWKLSRVAQKTRNAQHPSVLEKLPLGKAMSQASLHHY